jgi:hypothetical protein
VKLRALLIADAVVFAVAAATFVALFPSNFESDDQSPLYIAAWWLTVGSLLVLIVGALVALAMRFAKPS